MSIKDIPKNRKINLYRPEIDGLRAFAVITVIINHINKDFLPSGYLGVDIFFVISGYVITSSLHLRKNKTFIDFIATFYERRIKRLIPALIIFVLIASFITCLFNIEPTTTLRTGISSLFGMSNFYLLKVSSDYFSLSSELNVFTHTWSLAVEEQFYLLFPILVWFSGFGRQTKNGSKNLFISVLCLVIISLISFIYLYSINQPVAYYLMPPRFWEMALGCLVFISIQKKMKISCWLEKISPSLILALMIGIMLLPQSFGRLATISIVILSSLMIFCLNENKISYKFFTNKTAIYIGSISYSLYLWHWGVLATSRWTIGIHWWSIPFQLSLIYFLSVISYRWIETPIRKKDIFFKRYLQISAGFLALIFSSLIILTLERLPNSFLFVGKNRFNNYSDDRFWDRKLCNNVPHNIEHKYNKEFFDNCWFKNKKNITNRNKIKKVFFYGNSYNEQLMPMVAKIFENKNDFMFNSFFTSGCLVSGEIRSKNERYPNCGKIFKSYIDYFNENSTRGDILVISTSPPSAHSYLLTENIKNNAKKIKSYIDEFKILSINLRDQNKFFVFTGFIPEIQMDPSVCSHWFAKKNNNCVNKEIFDIEQNRKINKYVSQFKELEDYGVIYLNIYDYLYKLMEKDELNIFDYYYNQSHISKMAAFKLSDFFEKKVLFTDDN